MSDALTPPLGATPSPSDGHGVDWKALIRLMAPVIGGIATGGGTAGRSFVEHLQHGQDLARQHREDQLAKADKKNKASADFLMGIGEHAQSFDDPIALHDFLRLAEDAGTTAGYVKPGDLANRFQVSPNKLADKRLRELTDQLDALERAGYNPDELAQTGATIKLKDGSAIPISAAMDLTRRRPVDAAGAAIPRPKKSDTNASTDYGRFLAKYAKEKGKSVDALTTADELDARKTFNTIDDKPPVVPKPSPASVDAQFTDLVDLWKTSHPGQEPPADVRTKLRVQAKKEIGQADDKAPNPTGRGANGLMPGQEFTISEKLAKVWQDSTKSQREVARQFQLMQTGLKRFREGDKNGGSQGVLVTFQKILDPASVVRESEYARSAAGISMLGRMEGYVDRLKAGGAGVPENELAGMVETAKQFVGDLKGFTDGQRKRIEAQAKKYQIDPALVFDDVAAGGDDAATQSALDILNARRKNKGAR